MGREREKHLLEAYTLSKYKWRSKEIEKKGVQKTFKAS